MSFELVRKVEDDGYASYTWRAEPVKNGWGDIILATKAVEEIADSVSITIEGPYAGEMDFSDIGLKRVKSYKDMKKEELERDENGEVKIYANIGGKSCRVGMEYSDGSIEARVACRDLKTVKLFSTAIKNALDKEISSG